MAQESDGCLQVLEYRGEHVRGSVADLREARYRVEGKDCYVSFYAFSYLILNTEKGGKCRIDVYVFCPVQV